MFSQFPIVILQDLHVFLVLLFIIKKDTKIIFLLSFIRLMYEIHCFLSKHGCFLKFNDYIKWFNITLYVFRIKCRFAMLFYYIYIPIKVFFFFFFFFLILCIGTKTSLKLDCFNMFAKYQIDCRRYF